MYHVRLFLYVAVSPRSNIVCHHSLVLDISFQNIPTARPAIEVALLYILTIFWLGK